MEETDKNIDSFHLAGIVPVAGQPLDFGLPWHDSCMPIAKNLLAVDRSVIECAYAGCETIWIVCNDDMQPLIRYRIGDWINDPVWISRKHDFRPSENRKQIPIFYVPILPKDRDKRDCLAWSVLHGAASAYSVGLPISKWVTPDRYYTSFPYGVYPFEFIRDYRKQISSREGFMLRHQGKTVQDGEYLGFTFTDKDFVAIRKHFRQNSTGMYKSTLDGSIPRDKLPLHERYSARNFSLEEVFEILENGDTKTVDCVWYNKIDNWESYCSYLGSGEKDKISRPSKLLFSYREFNRVGQDSEEPELGD